MLKGIIIHGGTLELGQRTGCGFPPGLARVEHFLSLPGGFSACEAAGAVGPQLGHPVTSLEQNHPDPVFPLHRQVQESKQRSCSRGPHPISIYLLSLIQHDTKRVKARYTRGAGKVH